MFPFLADQVSIDRVKNGVAAGQTNQTSDTVDTQGWDGVLFMILMGAITAGAATSCKARQGALSNMGDAADLLGTAQTIADSDDNKIFYIDVYKPRERYLDVQVLRATQDSVIDGIVAVKYRGRKFPATHGADVTGEKHASPAEGTA